MGLTRHELRRHAAPKPPLEAKSPFELRVNLGKDVPESDVRTALADRRHGIPAFVHDRFDGGRSRRARRRVDDRLHVPVSLLPQPGHLDDEQRHPGHGRRRRPKSCGKYRHGLKVMSGGFTLSGGEPLMQHRFAVKLFTAARAMGIHTALDTNGYFGDRLTDDDLEADQPRAARISRPGTRSGTAV